LPWHFPWHELYTSTFNRRTHCNSVLLTILSIFVFPWLTSLLLHCSFFPVDRLGWQRIKALWQHEWVDWYLY
jgi:hypothetical protein